TRPKLPGGLLPSPGLSCLFVPGTAERLSHPVRANATGPCKPLEGQLPCGYRDGGGQDSLNAPPPWRWFPPALCAKPLSSTGATVLFMVRACAKPGPLMRSASNLTLSPTFTCLSMAGSWTRKTMVMPSFISSFLIGPCLRVILPTDFVDLSHLTVDHGSLGHGYRREYRARE